MDSLSTEKAAATKVTRPPKRELTKRTVSKPDRRAPDGVNVSLNEQPSDLMSLRRVKAVAGWQLKVFGGDTENWKLIT